MVLSPLQRAQRAMSPRTSSRAAPRFTGKFQPQSAVDRFPVWFVSVVTLICIAAYSSISSYPPRDTAVPPSSEPDELTTGSKQTVRGCTGGSWQLAQCEWWNSVSGLCWVAVAVCAVGLLALGPWRRKKQSRDFWNQCGGGETDTAVEAQQHEQVLPTQAWMNMSLRVLRFVVAADSMWPGVRGLARCH